jgi:succinate dehydrogenase/fumarate reductase flavoprotein subunit
LEKSHALQDSPIERLLHMNPGAVDLYRSHKIDLLQEPLEVAVCAQHNNGGLSGNLWYESTNIKHLFPIGEVNGSHGVTRPGGSALNAGQVAGIRAAEYIANRYSTWTINDAEVNNVLATSMQHVVEWAELCLQAEMPWKAEIKELQERMSRSGAHIRGTEMLKTEIPLAWQQVHRLSQHGCKVNTPKDLKLAFRARQLVFSHAVYLEAIRFSLDSRVGSRGSSIVLAANGLKVHEKLDNTWKIAPEDTSFRKMVLETRYLGEDRTENRWVPCRPIPKPDSWFETAWTRYRNGDIYNDA